ncbi:MAG TPA: hypothetical protein VNH22_02665 [Blastocatellia bacterium]|jgi:hypothetical protein|nr:hypothetical protein [Blastocatellia bacterium]
MKPDPLRNIALLLLPVTLLISACQPGRKAGGGAEENNSAGAASAVITSSDGLSRITLPPGWKQEQELHEQADLQAADRANEMYVIVMSESKEDFRDMTVEKHSEFTRSALTEKLESPELSEPEKVTVDGLPGTQYEIRGGVDNLNIAYLHTTLESPTHFHQILAWTLKSRFDKNRPVLDAVIHSFKEVAPASK